MVLMLSILTAYVVAAERKAMANVDSNAFTSDTQVMLEGAGDQHIAMAWWIPKEFWEAAFARDTVTAPADKAAILKALSGVSVMAVVQADVSSLGAFRFYAQEEVERSMQLTYTGANEHKLRPASTRSIDPDLEVVLGMIKPILAAAMGNLGSNMHFFVLNDRKGASGRVIDPYDKGQIDIGLARRDGAPLKASILLPVDALYVPRVCPNGQQAHVSWNYCPWSGTALPR